MNELRDSTGTNIQSRFAKTLSMVQAASLPYIAASLIIMPYKIYFVWSFMFLLHVPIVLHTCVPITLVQVYLWGRLLAARSEFNFLAWKLLTLMKTWRLQTSNVTFKITFHVFWKKQICLRDLEFKLQSCNTNFKYTYYVTDFR